jgi:cell wall-associated NlpC family hydrolase
MNCWEVARKFYSEVLGRELKQYYDNDLDRHVIRTIVMASEKDFHKVRSPKFGDILLIRLHGVESHIGVYLDNGLFLHTTKSTGSCIDRVGRWAGMIVGYYSLDKEAA